MCAQMWDEMVKEDTGLNDESYSNGYKISYKRISRESAEVVVSRYHVYTHTDKKDREKPGYVSIMQENYL